MPRMSLHTLSTWGSPKLLHIISEPKWTISRWSEKTAVLTLCSRLVRALATHPPSPNPFVAVGRGRLRIMFQRQIFHPGRAGRWCDTFRSLIVGYLGIPRGKAHGYEKMASGSCVFLLLVLFCCAGCLLKQAANRRLKQL